MQSLSIFSKVICCSSALLLLSCADETKTEDTSKPLSADYEIDLEVVKLKEIAGRWKSPLGPLPNLDGKWITVYISDDKKILIEIRSVGKKFDIVHAFVNGDIEIGDKTFSATLSEGTGSLKDIKQARGELSEGVMHLQSDIGDVDLSFAGI